MSVAANDLQAPNGPVEPEMFPGETVDQIKERLNAFLAQSRQMAASFTWANPAADDAGVTAYALYLAFRQSYTLSLVRPASEDAQAEMLGSTEFRGDQRAGVKDLADWYWREWTNLSELASSEPSSPASVGVPSYQSTNEFDW